MSWLDVEENKKLSHRIPIGGVVSYSSKDYYFRRLFVVDHIRDCDFTPLYCVSLVPLAYPRNARDTVYSRPYLIYRLHCDFWLGGLAEYSLDFSGEVVSVDTFDLERYRE